jgi:hypothetical protein
MMKWPPTPGILRLILELDDLRKFEFLRTGSARLPDCEQHGDSESDRWAAAQPEPKRAGAHLENGHSATITFVAGVGHQFGRT